MADPTGNYADFGGGWTYYPTAKKTKKGQVKSYTTHYTQARHRRANQASERQRASQRSTAKKHAEKNRRQMDRIDDQPTSNGSIGSALKRLQTPISNLTDAGQGYLIGVSSGVDDFLTGYRRLHEGDRAAYNVKAKASLRAGSKALGIIGASYSMISETAYRAEKFQKKKYGSGIGLGISVAEASMVTWASFAGAGKGASMAAGGGPIAMVGGAVTGSYAAGTLASGGFDIANHFLFGLD